MDLFHPSVAAVNVVLLAVVPDGITSFIVVMSITVTALWPQRALLQATSLPRCSSFMGVRLLLHRASLAVFTLPWFVKQVLLFRDSLQRWFALPCSSPPCILDLFTVGYSPEFVVRCAANFGRLFCVFVPWASTQQSLGSLAPRHLDCSRTTTKQLTNSINGMKRFIQRAHVRSSVFK